LPPYPYPWHLHTCSALLLLKVHSGAFELNYSSDIDVSAFFDPDVFKGGAMEPGEAAARTLQHVTRILSDRTPDGYVFRTDLRLRPDPSSTPVAVSTRRAELYSESVGQNWERMVWIKARHSAGDPDAAAAFLKIMEPFVWRRHLDYWAISDVHSIKDMINAKAGDKSLHAVAADLKLGPGGIREVEFFVQTQQLLLGGRNPSLRVRGTREGLVQLVEMGVVESGAAADLSSGCDTAPPGRAPCADAGLWSDPPSARFRSQTRCCCRAVRLFRPRRV